MEIVNASQTAVNPFSPDVITGHLSAIFGQRVTELRALKVGKYQLTFSGNYDDLSLMTRDALRITPQAKGGVFLTANPILPDLLARRKNRIDRADTGELTQDSEVIRRQLLFVDFDPVRPRGLSSNDVEHRAAYQRSIEVRDELHRKGVPDPALLDSGNGFHLWYAIDLPNDDESTELVKQFLRSLSAKFSDEAVKIDTSVFNAGRICKFPGTIAQKGDPTPERPHRRARFIRPASPTKLDQIPVGLLKALAAEAPAENRRSALTGGSASPLGGAKRGQRSVGERAADYLSRMPESISGQHGHDKAYRAACVLVRGYNLTPEAALPLMQEWNSRCEPPWSERELLHKLEDAAANADGEPGYLIDENRRRPADSDDPLAGLDLSQVEFGEFGTAAVDDVPFAVPAGVALDGEAGATADDDGLTLGRPFGFSLPPRASDVPEADDDPHRLSRVFVGNFLSADRRRIQFWRSQFYIWSDHSYRAISEKEISLKVTESIKVEFDRICRWQKENIDPDKPAPITKKVTNSLVRDTVNAVKSMTLIPSTTDQPGWLCETSICPRSVLPVLNGLLSLPHALRSDRCLIDATPDYFSEREGAFEFDPSASCPNWLAFLESVWPGDTESQELLAQWFGYCLTSSNRHQKLLMLVGPPRSGKGTIGRTLKALIGERNTTSPKLSELVSQYGLSSLLGKSLALVEECRLSGRIDSVAVVETLLSITGGDAQNVQRKYMDTVAGVVLPIRFVLSTNEIPRLTDASAAITTRFLILQLTKSHSGSEDVHLGERIARELPGILNWSIRGLHRLEEAGRFLQPTSGQDALDELADFASPIRRFVDDVCELGPDLWIEKADLFRAWQDWREAKELPRISDAQFASQLFAVDPSIKSYRPRRGDDSGQRRIYCFRGITARFPENSFTPFN